MGDRTGVSWADKTFNGWKGCARVSAACLLCYAERGTSRWGMDLWGATKPRQIVSEATWRNPYRWQREAERLDRTYRVFGFSWADVFEDRDEVIEARKRFLGIAEDTPRLIWMLLTKRIENVPAMVPWGNSGWPPNVWIGTTVEQQRFAEQRLHHLVRIPAAVRFVSFEPLLGPIDLEPWLGRVPGGQERGIDWIISGGESGPLAKVRPTHPSWFRSLRDQALAYQVPLHHKQNGQFAMPDDVDATGLDVAALNRKGITMWPDGRIVAGPADEPGDGGELLWGVNRRRAGRLLDGQVWDSFPELVAA